MNNANGIRRIKHRLKIALGIDENGDDYCQKVV